jgi:DNA (cytosine-5)-methyltransferase 1
MRHLDLFSGIGGFALAARWVGWETVGFCEIDPFCQRVLRKHWPEVPLFEDVRKLYRFANEMVECPHGCDDVWCELCEQHYFECECTGPAQFEEEVGEVNIITAGFPCQDISLMREVSGEGKGIEGKRSGLWTETERLIGILRPEIAVLENVKALTVRGLGRVLGDMAAIGYDCEWNCIPARYVGAPHQRDRIFIVAYPNSEGLQGHSRYGDKIREANETGSASASCVPQGGNPEGWWACEPELDRVVDGISPQVDRIARIKALGNSIVPQCAEIIFKAIK